MTMPRIAPTEYQDPVEKPHSTIRATPLTIVDDQPVEHGSTCLFGIAALILVSVGVLSGSAGAAGSGALMAGLLILRRLMVDLRRGITSSIWGTWRRDKNRFAFRCNICFWSAVTLLWSLLGIVILLGWVHLPATWVA
jgi:hypothetical protein